MPRLWIAVIGAGIGGPAAAIGLARNGHQVTIYERSFSTSEVRYAFRITPNSDRCLKWLGINTVAGGAVSGNNARMMDVDGKTTHLFEENHDIEKAKKEGTSVFAFRPQLNGQLMDQATRSGVGVRLGVKVEHVDIENTTLWLEGGEKVTANLIIAADGVYSVVRPSIIDSTKFFLYQATGYNCFRFMVPKETLQKDKVMAPLIHGDCHMFSWKGNDKRILVYPVDFDRLFNVTITHPRELSDQEIRDDGSAAAVGASFPFTLSTHF